LLAGENQVSKANHDPDDPRILEGERLFLRVLLASPDGTATLAQATPPEYQRKPFPDGGRWRGSIPQRLAGRGIIGHVVAPSGNPTAHKSPRTARNKGLAAVWRLLDPEAGRWRLQVLDSRHSAPRPRTLLDLIDGHSD
jgi:hypothetical protein